MRNELPPSNVTFVKKILLILGCTLALWACDKEPAPSDASDGDAVLQDTNSADPSFSGPCSVEIVWSGESKETITYTYNDDGLVTKEVTDDKSDGEPDEVVERTYDQNGWLTTLSRDDGADGTMEANGANIAVSAGTYNITLDFSVDPPTISMVQW